MHFNKLKISATLTIIIAITLSTIPANAITGNSHPDNTHSFVGLVVFYSLDANGNQSPVSVSSGILTHNNANNRTQLRNKQCHSLF
jgi:hypothetical protein